MSVQIFKTKVLNEVLFIFLSSVCVKNENYYLLNNESYKKGNYNNINTDFINSIKNCYHLSKQHYIERKLNYNNFITIIRQICKSNNIIISKTIKYYKSNDYNIEYHIYYKEAM